MTTLRRHDLYPQHHPRMAMTPGNIAFPSPPNDFNNTSSSTNGTPHGCLDMALTERCIASFYYYFFASHPFVLPEKNLLKNLDDATAQPAVTAVRWIGSLYLPLPESTRLELLATTKKAIETATVKNGFLVQGMLLLGIALDGTGDADLARQMRRNALKLALDVGMNSDDFAEGHGRGCSTLKESWRRTWWELFMVDALAAGLHGETPSVFLDEETTVALPCEERHYISGEIPLPMPFESLEESGFGDEMAPTLSSFAYRITAGYNLQRLAELGEVASRDDKRMSVIDARLCNWRLHLPLRKHDSLQDNGSFDEMMFQAHMIWHATAMLLHRPFSNIFSKPRPAPNDTNPPNAYNKHTTHVMTSAGAVSDMIAYRTPIINHTHFLVEVLSISSTIHLGRWAQSRPTCNKTDLVQQQVLLNIGALRSLATIWKAAKKSTDAIQGISRQLYLEKTGAGPGLDRSLVLQTIAAFAQRNQR